MLQHTGAALGWSIAATYRILSSVAREREREVWRKRETEVLRERERDGQRERGGGTD